jgi:hypothetical protein
MGWKRIGNREYYYRSERRDGRIVSIYEPGQFGKLHAELVAGRRRLRNLELRAMQAAKDWAESSEGAVRDWLAKVHAFVGMVMVAAGFHQHKRQWRRKRRMNGEIGKVKPPAPGVETERLIERAARGDETCYGQVLALLDDPERGPVLVDGIGSLANVVRIKLVANIAGKDILLQEALHERLRRMSDALLGDGQSPIEAVLVERAVVCWLLVWRYEHVAVDVHKMPIIQADFQQRLITAAHNRLNSALKTLAQVRKLALPSLQLNIGENQVNVAGIGPTSAEDARAGLVDKRIVESPGS